MGTANPLLERVSRPLSAEPRPFLRWAGAKRHLLSRIVPLLPSSFGTYWEPFLGGGSLFFLLQPRAAVLSDLAGELIETYLAVRDRPDSVIEALGALKPGRDQYYAVRAMRPTDQAEKAARFIYLNQNCWNGLYRVNSRGEFNVPYGKPRPNSSFDTSNLRACASALATGEVELHVDTFMSVAPAAGDLVFFDPPYVTRHNNNGFVDYNELLFSWEHQKQLATLARGLASRGVSVIVTNANHDDVIELYPGFAVEIVERQSTIANDKKSRGLITELVLHKVVE